MPSTGDADTAAGHTLLARVLMLDGTLVSFNVQLKAPGQVLFDMVCKHLDLLESDYFGLEYSDPHGVKFWLDLERPLRRQPYLPLSDPVLGFCVKFYPADPARLEEEFTRYLFTLQLKRDLSQAHLQCNDSTAALIASYVIQAEWGDFTTAEEVGESVLRQYRAVPGQDQQLERRILDCHRRLQGQTPAEADLNLLETARRCELYGVKMHPAKDYDGVPLNLSVAHMGIVVFQNYYRVNTFSWAKIRKLSFKRCRFLVKLHQQDYGCGGKGSVSFHFETRDYCKNFWKKCVEHHGFFRCLETKQARRYRTRVVPRGSSFRFSGRTQRQVVEQVRDSYLKRQGFNRSQSYRSARNLSAGSPQYVGGPSAFEHPIITPNDNTQPSISPVDPSDCDRAAPASPSTPTTSPVLPAPAVSVSMVRSAVSDLMVRSVVDQPELASSPCWTSSPPAPAPSSPLCSSAPLSDTYALPVLSIEEVPPPSRSAVDRVTTPPASLTTPPASLTNGLPAALVAAVPCPAHCAPPLALKPRKLAANRDYFIAKELLNTERTYLTDLKILSVHLRSSVDAADGSLLDQLFGLVEPIYQQHCQLLPQLERRLLDWEQLRGGSGTEGGTTPLDTTYTPACAPIHMTGASASAAAPLQVCDLLLQLDIISLYEPYLDSLLPLLESLEREYRFSDAFKQICCEFETQKLCYLPIASLILKPAQRVLHYESILRMLVDHHPVQHADADAASSTLAEIGELVDRLQPQLSRLGDLLKLLELQRDLLGSCRPLAAGADRTSFIREGCLQKLSRKGCQHRMFFLFSEVLVYTSRTTAAVPQFKVHGELSLSGVCVEPTDPQLGVANCFTVFSAERVLVLAAGSAEERDAWLQDLRDAVEDVGRRSPVSAVSSDVSLPATSSCDEMSTVGVDSPAAAMGDSSQLQPSSWRSNRSPHVCWHRGLSYSRLHGLRALPAAHLSGFLLRKFKHSDGWQKLWVVLANLCLYFYKSYQDEVALTSLPLLGYTVSEVTATSAALTNGESGPGAGQLATTQQLYVLQLQFKQHVYLFRADSRYTLNRWLQLMALAAGTAAAE